MNEINKINLSEQTKFWLDEISIIEKYFIEEINQRKSCRQKSSKYVTTFDNIDKILIFLSATTRGVSIISFISVTRVRLGVVSASFTLIFSSTNGIGTKLLNITRKKRKIMIKFLCCVKVNSIVLTQYLKH